MLPPKKLFFLVCKVQCSLFSSQFRRSHFSVKIEFSKTLSVSCQPEQPALNSEDAADQFYMWLKESKSNIAVLSGAGISTDSGIPDYRGPTGSYSTGHKPVTHDNFMRSHRNRQRYWSRSIIGWEWFRNARPNPAHFALSNLEKKGVVSSIITQNVDMLHQKAGSRNVIDLHGVNSIVKCMSCGIKSCRSEIQEKLILLNSEFFEKVSIASLTTRLADGDMEILFNADNFEICSCEACGGILKPDVIFFGDNVPQDIVQKCYDIVENANALLVVGSSLAVYSGFRFVDAAVKQGKSVAILNLGDTRADLLSVLKFNYSCSEVLVPAATRFANDFLQS